MNTIAIGFAKAVMLNFINWNGLNFFLFFPVLTVSGVFIPILVKKYLLVKFAWLNKITS
jgi:hypothetical protein